MQATFDQETLSQKPSSRKHKQTKVQLMKVYTTPISRLLFLTREQKAKKKEGFIRRTKEKLVLKRLYCQNKSPTTVGFIYQTTRPIFTIAQNSIVPYEICFATKASAALSPLSFMQRRLPQLHYCKAFYLAPSPQYLATSCSRQLCYYFSGA